MYGNEWSPEERDATMTSKVAIITNGRNYVTHYTVKNKIGDVFQTGSVRGHPEHAQGYIEVYIQQDYTIEVVERYEPVDVEPATPLSS
jgi:hypothetical protein